MKLVPTIKISTQIAKISMVAIVLLSTNLFFGRTSKAELISNSSQLVTQFYPQWTRYTLDYTSSVNFPARSYSTPNGLSTSYRGIYYLASSEKLDSKFQEICSYLNCKTVMGMLVKKAAKKYNLTVQNLQSIAVNTRRYPADGVEFIAKSYQDGSKVKGRIYIIGNRFYILSVSTKKTYFDTEANIFLQSLSLI